MQAERLSHELRPPGAEAVDAVRVSSDQMDKGHLSSSQRHY